MEKKISKKIYSSEEFGLILEEIRDSFSVIMRRQNLLIESIKKTLIIFEKS